MLYSKIKRLTGFTLIEVLIGLFIATIGIIGVVQLQKNYIQAGAQADGVSIATELANERLNAFYSVNTYDEIIDGNDAAPITRSNFSFNRSWAIQERYYNDDSDTWQNDTTGIDPVPSKSDEKQVTVTVTWQDSEDNAQQVAVTATFSRSTLQASSSTVNDTSSAVRPQVAFNAGSTPENPPIDLWDDSFGEDGSNADSKETSKPIPTVYATEQNNYVQFETVIFDPESKTQSLEDFVTVNCSCSFDAGVELATTPHVLTLTDDKSKLILHPSSGEKIEKVTGSAIGSKQPALCSKCCQDHHDSSEAKFKYTSSPLIPILANGNHAHYNSALEQVDTGNYTEACRFKRINGYYELVPDWQLVKIITMPESFFVDATNVESYISYVKTVVKEYLLGVPEEEKTSFDTGIRYLTDIVPGSQQMISKGIYVDTLSMSPEDLSTVIGAISTEPNWLELVPFYEINLTLFSEWSSDNPAIVGVTNEAISTLVDGVNYYGTYSRGRISALTDGVATISTNAKVDNTGITGSSAISNLSKVKLEDAIQVSVKAAGKGDNSITINVNCLTLDNKGTETACASKEVNSGLSWIISPASITCEYNKQQGQNTAFLACNGLPNWSGTITFKKENFEFTPAQLSISLSGGTNYEGSVVMDNIP